MEGGQEGQKSVYVVIECPPAHLSSDGLLDSTLVVHAVILASDPDRSKETPGKKFLKSFINLGTS